MAAAKALARMRAAYPSAWPSPSPRAFGRGASPRFRAWAESFYRRPHPELLPGALLELVRASPGAAVGAASLPAAVFLSEVARGALHGPTEGAALMDALTACVREAREAPGAGVTGAADEALEKADTVLRALWLANTPACDSVLEAAASQWSDAMGGGGGGGGGGAATTATGAPSSSSSSSSFPSPSSSSSAAALEGRGETEVEAALGRSLFPPAGQRHRAHITQWPLPVMNLTLFERHLSACDFPLYGCTRFWFMHTRAVRSFATSADARVRGRVGLLSPRLAQDLTVAIVDALWASFYATGAAVAVLRVLDVATLYLEFLDEPGLGERFVMPAADAAEGADGRPTADGADEDATLLPPPPSHLLEDPLTLMRFEASRHALHSLLRHAAAHVAVGEAVLAQHDSLEERVNFVDPAGNGDGALTGFGAKRLQLLRRLRPTLEQLARHAKSEGVGSGKWPQCMAILHGASSPDAETSRLIEADAGQSHHSAAGSVDKELSDAARERARPLELDARPSPVRDIRESIRRGVARSWRS